MGKRSDASQAPTVDSTQEEIIAYFSNQIETLLSSVKDACPDGGYPPDLVKTVLEGFCHSECIPDGMAIRYQAKKNGVITDIEGRPPEEKEKFSAVADALFPAVMALITRLEKAEEAVEKMSGDIKKARAVQPPSVLPISDYLETTGVSPLLKEAAANFKLDAGHLADSIFVITDPGDLKNLPPGYYLRLIELKDKGFHLYGVEVRAKGDVIIHENIRMSHFIQHADLAFKEQLEALNEEGRVVFHATKREGGVFTHAKLAQEYLESTPHKIDIQSKPPKSFQGFSRPTVPVSAPACLSVSEFFSSGPDRIEFENLKRALALRLEQALKQFPETSSPGMFPIKSLARCKVESLLEEVKKAESRGELNFIMKVAQGDQQVKDGCKACFDEWKSPSHVVGGGKKPGG